LVQHGANDRVTALVQLLQYVAHFVSTPASGADGKEGSLRDPD
jgi:hypothetical protein